MISTVEFRSEEDLIAPISYPHERRNFELRLRVGASKTGMHALVIFVHEHETPLGWCMPAPKRTSVLLKEKALGKELEFRGDYLNPAIREFKISR